MKLVESELNNIINDLSRKPRNSQKKFEENNLDFQLFVE